jgi:catechol 2,3-dioxygenase-like lactoylglutathione lyase family enzyme
MALDPRRLARAALAAVAAGTVVALAGCARPPEPADPAAVAEHVASVGVAPELVHVLDLDGFELVPQSVGVSGTDGMSAAYVRTDDAGVATIMLTTDRGGAGEPCETLPDAGRSTYTCSATRGEATVRLEGADVDAATMREAAGSVRVPTTAELDELFATVQGAGGTVERGDLPEAGDGAPVDPTGAGG